jgi:hypothetical protein
MTIYILDNDIENIPKYLDDKSLARMIKDIAQTLCNSHYSPAPFGLFKRPSYELPLKFKRISYYSEWYYWTRKSQANYLYVLKLGFECLDEFYIRMRDDADIYLRKDKYENAIFWARDNIPELSEHEQHFQDIPEYPIDVIPKNYQIKRLNISLKGYYPKISIIESYREWYKSKCILKNNSFVDKRTKKELKWTNRTPPKWLYEDQDDEHLI